jgi:acyl carrier protein
MTPEDRIRQFVEKKFRARAVGDDTLLFSSGLVDSFGVLELIAFLEDEFKVEIDTNTHEIRDFDSIRQIAGLVASVSGTPGGA